jgi:drug/metabolite transporter (DMT)-like permease
MVVMMNSKYFILGILLCITASFAVPTYLNYTCVNVTGFGAAFDCSSAVTNTATGNPNGFGLMVLAAAFLGFYIIGSRYTQERALIYSMFMTTIVAFLLVSGDFLSSEWLIFCIIALMVAVFWLNRVN